MNNTTATPATTDPASRRTALIVWLRRFWPAIMPISGKERMRMLLGICLCVGVVTICAHWWGMRHPPGLWMVASLAASSVLVIALPSSPLAQPWAVLGGSVLSAILGVLVASLVSEVMIAAPLAVGLAVLCMLLLRCLHPPGASLALLAVIEPAMRSGRFISFVLFDVLVLIIVAIVFNRLAGRAYPHVKLAETTGSADKQGKPSPFTASDLDEALKSYNGVLDISRADLEKLLHTAARAAFQRTLGDLRCEDIMSSPVHTVLEDATLAEAWEKMEEFAVKALAIVDDTQHVIGIVSTTDLLHAQFAQDPPSGFGEKLRSWIPWRGAKKARTVGALMSSPVVQARMDQHVMDLVPMFSEKSRRHIPIVDDGGRLVGIISQTDVIRTLAAALTP